MKRTLLVVSSKERRTLVENLEQIGFEVSEATTCEAARSQLEVHRFEVVVAQDRLPDGAWCNVLREILDRGLASQLVVAAERPGGWAWSRPVQRGGEYTLEHANSTGTVRAVFEGT